VMVYITRLTLPGLLNGSYVIGFVTGNEGRGDCHWLGLVHSWGREDHIDTHVDQGFARVSRWGGEAQGILLDDCTISISMTLQIHFLW
jgi:hypothetical protein